MQRETESPSPARPRGSRAALVAVLLVTAVLSLVLRRTASLAHDWPKGPNMPQGWFVNDPDSQYHFRRVARAFEEGLPIAETDPYLNYPHGARIPWPPYYDLAVYAMLKPFAPENANERRHYIEQTAASFSPWWGTATSAMCALAGWYLAGPAGGLVAGSYHALTMASVNYSNLGNADHHAWVSMLMAAMLMLVTGGIARGALECRKKAVLWGGAAGAVGGVLLGSWVASLMYVLMVQLVMGWLLILNTRRPFPRLAYFGLAFHLAAAVTVIPAVLTSPWKEEFPWMVVNLSWFHPAQLLAGAAVFVPLFRLRPGTRVFRWYPAIVVASLGGLALILYAAGTGPAAGIQEGFNWVSRANVFMAIINESLPLVGPKSDGLRYLGAWLGWGVLLLPFAWLAAGKRAFFDRFLPLLPWVLAVPPLMIQALQQRRFAEAFAVPAAVMLGWAAGALYLAHGDNWWGRRATAFRALPGWATFTVGLLLVGACHEKMIGATVGRITAGHHPGLDVNLQNARGQRLLYTWLRRNSPEPADYSVLASWDDGHAIEWAADRPTVATNFGNYVGDGFYVPPAFFMEEDPAVAEALLQERKVRYVLVSHLQDRRTPAYIRLAGPEKFGRYASREGPDEIVFSLEWSNTIGHKLARDGFGRDPDGRLLSPFPVRFLRLVHVSPIKIPQPRQRSTAAELPAGWIWEHVPGAVLEARGAPGEVLTVNFQIRYKRADYTVNYEDKAAVGRDGVARMRLPYATIGPNGDGEVAGRATWSLGDRRGRLQVREADVLEGNTIRLQ